MKYFFGLLKRKFYIFQNKFAKYSVGYRFAGLPLTREILQSALLVSKSSCSFETSVLLAFSSFNLFNKQILRNDKSKFVLLNIHAFTTCSMATMINYTKRGIRWTL